MRVVDAIILGAVQGATEFIPVSSTGHLVLGERFLDLPSNFTFSVLLNIGTLIALFIFFRKRIAEVAAEVFKGNLKYIVLLIVATIPAGLVGLLLDDKIEKWGSNLYVVCAALIVIGIVMVVAGNTENSRVQNRRDIKPADSLRVGLAQMLALVPGVSRSGITILTAINTGFTKSAAAEFSFMMAIPIIIAATLKTLLSSDGRTFISDNTTIFLAGNLASMIVGYLAVKFLVGLLNRHGLKGFGWYRIALGLLLIVLLSVNII